MTGATAPMTEFGILLFKVCSLWIETKYLQFRAIRASRRAAVGLAGVAPRLVSSRGRAALIPDASSRLCGPGLRATLALQGVGCSAHPRRTLFGAPDSRRTGCA